MNTKHFKFVLPIVLLAALFLAACGGILAEKPNVPPVGAYQACSLGAPQAVIVDGKKWICADLAGSSVPVAVTSSALVKTIDGPAATAVADPTVETPFTTVITNGEWPTALFQTPVSCTKSFNDASKWLLCEPGVLLDASTAWTIPSTDQVYSSNVPEGAFTYYSCGQCTITVDGVQLVQTAEKGLNYLIVVRGKIDDGIVDSDLNKTAKVTSFVPGHMIYSHTPTGAYVSHDWFKQQLIASTTSKFTNCGATGCTRTKIILFDTDTHFYQKFLVQAGAVDNWTLLEEGTK